MRPCDEITELISASLDNMLTEQEQAELDSHLAACPVCSALYAQLVELHQACADLEELNAPEGFSERVKECIAADSTQEQPTNVIPFPTTKKSARSPWKRWGITAAAVAIVVLGAVSLPSQLDGAVKEAANSSREVADMAAPIEYAVAEAEMPAFADCESYAEAKPEMAPMEPVAPAASAEAPVPMPSAAPEEALSGNTTARGESFDSSLAPVFLGTLTISAKESSPDLEQFDAQIAEDGTKTYTVPAEFFFTLKGSEQFKLSSSNAQYGLVVVTP